MATKTATISLQRRVKSGTTASNAARREGQVPGVLYGHGQPAVSVAIDAKALGDVLHAGKQTDLFAITLDGANDTAMIRSLQRDPISRKIVHADLQRVGRNEEVQTSLQVITIGTPIGVKDMGGVMDVVTHAVEVSGPADKMPDAIRIDVSELALHGHITGKDLPLPPGFKLLTPADAMIVSVEPSRTEKQAEADLTQTTPEPVAPVEGAPPAPGGSA